MDKEMKDNKPESKKKRAQRIKLQRKNKRTLTQAEVNAMVRSGMTRHLMDGTWD